MVPVGVGCAYVPVDLVGRLFYVFYKLYVIFLYRLFLDEISIYGQLTQLSFGMVKNITGLSPHQKSSA